VNKVADNFSSLKPSALADRSESKGLEFIKDLTANTSHDTEEHFLPLHKPKVQTKKCEKLDRMNGMRILDGYLRNTGLKLNDTKNLITYECEFFLLARKKVFVSPSIYDC
jgi:hypothetical protein